MEQEILQDLKNYLGNDYDEDQENTFLFCIKRAIKSFENIRNYPENYSEQIKNKDMEKFYMCIFDLTLYWCNTQGMEFQKSHSESGVSRSFESESEIYSLHKVVSIARIF